MARRDEDLDPYMDEAAPGSRRARRLGADIDRIPLSERSYAAALARAMLPDRGDDEPLTLGEMLHLAGAIPPRLQYRFQRPRGEEPAPLSTPAPYRRNAPEGAEFQLAPEPVMGPGPRVGREPPTPVEPPPPAPVEPPPPAGAAAMPMSEAMDVLVPPPSKSWAQGLPRAQPAASSAEIPSLRGLPTDQAIEIARRQHHLIEGGEGSPGLYVGGPRDIQTKRQLSAQRRAMDNYLAQNIRGADWYDRQRAGIGEVTGYDPAQSDWMSRQEGMFSAGVPPESELAFALKENNAAIAGMPVKAARPAQHEAHERAVAMKDPSQFMLGDKTAEYAKRSDYYFPTKFPLGATGVNDFRHFFNLGFRDVEGDVERAGIKGAPHAYADYETALWVDRANKAKLGGRSDWTGEQIQAAAWVHQKAEDIMADNPKLTYAQAFERANKSIAEYFPKHEYYATHEAQPGAATAETGHMPGSVSADAAARQEFFEHPGSDWKGAHGRDVIYSGLGIEGTGNYMRVRPSLPMTGLYTPPGGAQEANPGEVARPLGGFTAPKQYEKEFIGPHEKEPFKRATDADRAIMDAGEAVRAALDAQNVTGWHKLWFGGPNKESNTLFYPGQGPANLADMLAAANRGRPYGLGDVADTGKGMTSTSFWPPPPGGKDFDKALKAGVFTLPGRALPVRARMDSNAIDYINEWKEGVGSGAVTRKLLDYITKTPEMRAAFNNNQFLPERALAKFERDKEWASRWGAPREDIQNLRQVIANSKNDWIDRLEAALKDKSISLPAVAALMAGSAALYQEGPPGPTRERAARREL